jgi:prepilin-type N-terminal cleavage/methylation domain-containing protein
MPNEETMPRHSGSNAQGGEALVVDELVWFRHPAVVIRHFPDIHPRSARTGFTLLELLLGLVISGLVMGAVAAFLLATGSRWMQSGTGQSVYLAGGQAAIRFQQVIRDSAAVGAVQPGALEGSSVLPAAIMLWRGDRNGDGEVQLSEIALIEHDRIRHRLMLYQIRFPDEMAPEQREAADLTVTYDSISESGAAASFKALQHVEAVPLVANVAAVKVHLHAPAAGQRPIVELAMKVQKEGQINVEYTSAALRGPIHPGSE